MNKNTNSKINDATDALMLVIRRGGKIDGETYEKGMGRIGPVLQLFGVSYKIKWLAAESNAEFLIALVAAVNLAVDEDTLKRERAGDKI